MRAYSEHLDKIQYVRNSLENEILWVRKVFFKDIFSNRRLEELVDEYKLPILNIWYQGMGLEPAENIVYKKSDKAIWDLNILNEHSKEIDEQNLTYVMLKTKCPKEVILEIMKVMDVVYMFCGRREYDPSDPECVRQYCNVYMADYVYNSDELLNKLIVPINEVAEQAKIDFKKDK